MPLYRLRDRVILFVHIPKTGGSTIEAALRGAGAAEALMTGRDEWGKASDDKLARCSMQHLHYAALTSLLDMAFVDYALAVVRNPYARLASEYRWRTERRRRGPGLDAWLRRRFDRLRSDPYEKDNHFRPQSEFVGEGVEVFHFEDGLHIPVRAAAAALGLAEAGRDLPTKRRSDSRAPIPMTPASHEQVRALYRADFAAFGYDPDVLPDETFEVVPARAIFPVRLWS